MQPQSSTSRQQFVRVCACGCGEPTLVRRFYGTVNTYVRGHNNRVVPTKKTAPNTIRIEGDVAYLCLLHGQVALLDADMVEKVSPWHWLATWTPKAGAYYIAAPHRKTTVQLARIIMDAPRGMVVDHKDHNTLDNRRANLRVVTQRQNMQNRRGPSSNSTTGIRGVTYGKTRKGAPLYRGQLRMTNGKYRAKNFPFTPEGKRAADAWVRAQRAIFMPYSDYD